MSSRGAVVLSLCIALLAACAPTLVAVRSYRGHGALDDEALAALSELAESGGLTKAAVLSRLGPPLSTLGQGGGDIFVYRHVARDTSEINLNPSYVVPAVPPVSLYVNSEVSGRDDLLMIFFGEDGEVIGASMRQSVRDVSGSRAASQSKRVRGWVE